MHCTGLGTDLNPPETAVSPPAPTDTVRGSRLYGRRAECQALDRLLADVRTGQSRVMIIRGMAEPARPRSWITWPSARQIRDAGWRAW